MEKNINENDVSKTDSFDAFQTENRQSSNQTKSNKKTSEIENIEQPSAIENIEQFSEFESENVEENVDGTITENAQNSNNKPAKLTKKQEVINAIKFVLFSISAGVVQILSFTILSELVFNDAGNEYGLSYFISLVLSVLWNFTFNRKFTFKSAKNVPIAMALVFAYYCVFTPLSILWGVALTKNAGWNEYIVLFITMVINMATEFLWTRFVVYRNDINTAVKNKQNDNK